MYLSLSRLIGGVIKLKLCVVKYMINNKIGGISGIYNFLYICNKCRISDI